MSDDDSPQRLTDEEAERAAEQMTEMFKAAVCDRCRAPLGDPALLDETARKLLGAVMLGARIFGAPVLCAQCADDDDESHAGRI